MKLLTEKLVARFKKLGEQSGEEAIVVAKFFDPTGSWTWYATEWHPDHCGKGQGAFFGLVDGHEIELGFFALSDLAGYRHPHYQLGIERDIYWEEKTVAQVREKLEALRAGGVA